MEGKPKRKRINEAARRRRLGKTFPSASSLLGLTDSSEEALQQHRERLLCKADKLAFPPHATGFYLSAIAGRQYGRDTPHGGPGIASYHKSILSSLLNEFILTHQWKEVAAVLSVLLRAVLCERAWNNDYLRYFWATMDVIRQLEGLEGNESIFNKIYQILYDHQPKDIFSRDKPYEGAVRLEQALFLMGQKHYEEAQFASRPLMDTPSYRDNAVANMIHGLINYYWWFALITKEARQNVSAGHNGCIEVTKLELGEGMGESEGLSSGNIGGMQSIKEETILFSESLWFDVEAERKPILNEIEETHVNMNFYDEASKEGLEKLYGYSDAEGSIKKNYLKKAKVFVHEGLDKRLFPISLTGMVQGSLYMVPMLTVRVKDCHSTATKHLQKALSLDTRMRMAQLPLLQLMLAVGDVEGAYEEIERCCQESNDCLPFRIKAILLKSLTPKNKDMLVCCCEDTLERDPSSIESINGLIKLHNDGQYKVERMVESIAFHLDGCSGLGYVWNVFMMCFEKLEKAENDYQSCNKPQGSMKDELQESTSNNELLEFFGEEHRREMWKLRAKWWPRKHFESKSISEEVLIPGGLSRIVYKAACAAHIFGLIDYAMNVEAELVKSGHHQHVMKLKVRPFTLMARFIDAQNTSVLNDLQSIIKLT